MPDRFPPDSPHEWINRAKSSLALAKKRSHDVYYEDLCFQAQQAAEKAIKAIFISKNISFPFIHDIAALLTLLEQEGGVVPDEMKKASMLTIYASQTRYPGFEPPLSEEEYRQAVRVAGSVVRWADRIISDR
jgi:HEPN domain-containing protein